jgi:hypothetical protein
VAVIEVDDQRPLRQSPPLSGPERRNELIVGDERVAIAEIAKLGPELRGVGIVKENDAGTPAGDRMADDPGEAAEPNQAAKQLAEEPQKSSRRSRSRATRLRRGSLGVVG